MISPIFDILFKKIYEKRKSILLKLAEKNFVPLSIDEIIEINKRIIEIHKGVHDIRDINALQDCVNSVFNKAFVSEKEELLKIALELFEKIITNRPFIEGNKRTAIVCFEMFLRNNDVDIDLSNDFLYRLAIQIENRELRIEDVAKSLKEGKT